MLRKLVIKTVDIKDANAKPVLDKIKEDIGIDLRVEKAEFQAHLDRVKKVETLTRVREQAGSASSVDSDTARFYRLEAEEAGPGEDLRGERSGPGCFIEVSHRSFAVAPSTGPGCREVRGRIVKLRRATAADFLRGL